MRKLAMGMALASTALASPALAKEGQWYIGVDGGAMIVDDATVDGTDISVDHNEGYDFGAVVGHDFGAFRLETEVAYKKANLESIEIGPDEYAANGEGNFLAWSKVCNLQFQTGIAVTHLWRMRKRFNT